MKIGVARGGPSAEYDVSLMSGAEVLKHLPGHYDGLDVLITKDGQWYSGGLLREPRQIFDNVDLIFNALHGEFGEDGRVQQIFESYNIPYTGSQIIPSSLAMRKHRAREIFTRHGIKIPRALVFSQDEFLPEDPEYAAQQVFEAIPPLWVVKPASRGSSVGVSICQSFSELVDGIENAFSYDNTILVEEYIKGREATCGVLENFRSENLYAFPPVEIIPPEGNFFDYTVKYNGATREICPANFDSAVKRELENLAKRAHQILDCRHYSRSDFIVSPRGVYLLETNTLPGLTAESLLPKAARVSGLEFSDFLDHVIKLALL